MTDEIANIVIPAGLKILHTLRYHISISNMAWSPDGQTLAVSPTGSSIQLWNMETGESGRRLEGHSTLTTGLAWSPDGQTLAVSSTGPSIQLWNVETGKLLGRLKGRATSIKGLAWSPNGRTLAVISPGRSIQLLNSETGKVQKELPVDPNLKTLTNLAWSPDGRTLALSGDHIDKVVQLWDIKTGKLRRQLKGHSGYGNVAWSPDGRTLAVGSTGPSIQIWDFETGQVTNVLEGHTRTIRNVSFSSDGRILASRDINTIRLWDCKPWNSVAALLDPYDADAAMSLPRSRILAFHPRQPLLASMSERLMAIYIWELDLPILLGSALAASLAYYTNAKVVLVGDSGVGKSGLGLVLTGQPFVPTESTHGRHVWTFDNQEVELDNVRKETRQTLLWDLAGQPGYRLIHQLHLNEVAVALVLFDARSEIDPFAGVYHWDRALRQAQRVQSNSAPPLKKYLVAARIDRGGKSASPERIDSLVRELGFDGYFETSAKEEKGITELAEAIKQAIDWSALPKVTSNDLFQQIKDFLISEKEAGHLLSTAEDLYRIFLKSDGAPKETVELPAQFETCIGRVESRDLIRRLGFGNLVLLQPELLDFYASALVNAVKDEPDGLGSIAEEKARAGNFSVPQDERLKDKEQEKLLLIAMVEDLLRHEIVLREQADEGTYLVFPSQSTRENPDLPDPEGKSVIFDFEGPVQNIFATLAVRLSHSGVFKKNETWKDAVTFTARVGGTCGMFLHNIGEGHGELTLFYEKTIGEEMRFYFEEYVHTHLQRRAIVESIQRRRIFVCPKCGEPFTDSQVKRRREAGYDLIRCGVCDTQVSILDREERLTPNRQAVVQEMDRSADAQRDLSAAASKLQGKIATGDFDVFLCHNGKNKPRVKEIGEKLKEQGILPWLDEWELRPGFSWQRLLEKQIRRIKSVAVFVGKDGIGPWQQKEVEAFLIKFANRHCPVIPVLLPDAPRKPRWPIFLESMTWVDFRVQDPNPFERLIWGITGERERFG